MEKEVYWTIRKRELFLCKSDNDEPVTTKRTRQNTLLQWFRSVDENVRAKGYTIKRDQSFEERMFPPDEGWERMVVSIYPQSTSTEPLFNEAYYHHPRLHRHFSIRQTFQGRYVLHARYQDGESDYLLQTNSLLLLGNALQRAVYNERIRTFL